MNPYDTGLIQRASRSMVTMVGRDSRMIGIAPAPQARNFPD
jgi:hypothetical protein